MLYPIGIQDFGTIREGGFAYVDKTAFVYQLANRGQYYFLSRPRRFGKSLLVSTLEAYFLGKRELFEGLAIEKLEKDWVKYPVLHLDLNAEEYNRPKDLPIRINIYLKKWEAIYGANTDEESISDRFSGVIERAYEQTGQKVVILIDEYDKPLLEAIGNEELTKAYRSTLSAFYSVMKNQGKFIRFALLTGVTKFSKVTIFSGLNNLRDISMLDSFAGVCGVTESELHSYFNESVVNLAEENDLSVDECYAKLKQRYDGYHFSKNAEGVYNPFSLLNAFEDKEFSNYWFRSGTPTFLTEVIRNADFDLTTIQTAKVSADDMGSTENPAYSPIPVLYQAGYLTITGYDPDFETYRLGFPNREVELGFMNYLVPTFIRKRDMLDKSFLEDFVHEVRAGKPEGFIKRLQAMLAGNNYQVAGEMEIYFQNVMYVIFRLLGFHTHVESATSDGRIDLKIETADYIYLIEIKLDGSADEALRQIEDKKYAAQFAFDKRRLFKIGVNFSSKTRGISEWKVG